MADLIYRSIHTGEVVDNAVSAVKSLDFKLQKELVSGDNIRTINGKTLLGNSDIDIIQANPTLSDADTASLNSVSIYGVKYKLSPPITGGAFLGNVSSIDQFEALTPTTFGDYFRVTAAFGDYEVGDMVVYWGNNSEGG